MTRGSKHPTGGLQGRLVHTSLAACRWTIRPSAGKDGLPRSAALKSRAGWTASFAHAFRSLEYPTLPLCVSQDFRTRALRPASPSLTPTPPTLPASAPCRPLRPGPPRSTSSSKGRPCQGPLTRVVAGSRAAWRPASWQQMANLLPQPFATVSQLSDAGGGATLIADTSSGRLLGGWWRGGTAVAERLFLRQAMMADGPVLRGVYPLGELSGRASAQMLTRHAPPSPTAGVVGHSPLHGPARYRAQGQGGCVCTSSLAPLPSPRTDSAPVTEQRSVCS
jgi:hypothetical protein